MNYQRYLAELLGTFTLTFVVWLSVAFTMPFSTPIVAALTVGLFVYLIGKLSGAHVNPAISIALFTTGDISKRDAVLYVVAQLAGATLALFLGTLLNGEGITIPTDGSLIEGAAEALGTFFLAFGVTAVTHKRVDPLLSGLVVGVSLFIGIYIAFPFANAILNPAVALGIGSFHSMYILGPIAGAICGAWSCKKLFELKKA